ncbi:hypothetical protein [Nocardia sp. NPDC050793]|uniref:hypothetical protein n=1 Tax=Nocardia sp. NPDC050793 TaxID=3155159 RepID=UPI0033E0351A
MADAFFTVNNRPRSVTGIRRDSDGNPQTLERSIPDGDTTGVHVQGSMLVRFLGIDTPEKRIDLPGPDSQTSLDSDDWETYLSDPFRPEFGAFDLYPSLAAHLATRIGAGAAANHHRHALKAGDSLRELVQLDMTALGQTAAEFNYFLAFEFEVFDSRGRFLAFVNRDQPNPTVPSPRPLSYNERQLQRGVALPFFIWPNIDPFRDVTLLDAVLEPGTAHDVATTSPSLKRAREFVKQARADKKGVFDPQDPLRFEAFEIRYLARRQSPDRAVIDLSRNDDTLRAAQRYFEIPNPEDRLYIPPQFVSLFVSRGWQLED